LVLHVGGTPKVTALSTKWNGTVGQRIAIVPFKWQKRRFTKAPKAKRARQLLR